jgi:hypothetical protein
MRLINRPLMPVSRPSRPGWDDNAQTSGFLHSILQSTRDIHGGFRLDLDGFAVMEDDFPINFNHIVHLRDAFVDRPSALICLKPRAQRPRTGSRGPVGCRRLIPVRASFHSGLCKALRQSCQANSLPDKPLRGALAVVRNLPDTPGGARRRFGKQGYTVLVLKRPASRKLVGTVHSRGLRACARPDPG